MELLTQATVYVTEPELTSQVTTFFLNLIEKVNIKLCDNSKLIVMSYYEGSVIAALLSVIPNDKQSSAVTNKVS